MITTKTKIEHFNKMKQLFMQQKFHKISAEKSFKVFAQKICGLHALQTSTLWTLLSGGYFKKRACKKKHHSVESLKCDLLKKWENFHRICCMPHMKML